MAIQFLALMYGFAEVKPKRAKMEAARLNEMVHEVAQKLGVKTSSSAMKQVLAAAEQQVVEQAADGEQADVGGETDLAYMKRCSCCNVLRVAGLASALPSFKSSWSTTRRRSSTSEVACSILPFWRGNCSGRGMVMAMISGGY